MTPTSPDPDRQSPSRRSRRPSSPRTASRSDQGPDAPMAALLSRLKKPELREPFRFWRGEGGPPTPSRVGDMRDQLAQWMSDTERVSQRVRSLDDRSRALLNAFVQVPGHRRSAADLAPITGATPESAVEPLKRLALLFDDHELEGPGWFLPRALAKPLAARPATEAVSLDSEIFRALTLKGAMEWRYGGPGAERPMKASRIREMFKMYANEAQAVARVERLPEGLRDLIAKVVLEFGGLLPRRFFEKMETELPHWNQRRWAKILGESLVGTVQRLELSPYGIHHDDDTLIVHNEITLAWFKRIAVPSDPDAPHDDCSLGVDAVSNISRFFAYLIDNNVRFTVKGEIFKTTEKRILTDLIPNPGRELERAEILQFIFDFARRSGFVEVTGERTFQLTGPGRDWEAQGLDAKLGHLFDHVTADLDLDLESVHQLAMRQVLLKMMKRLEVGIWYDVMYLPFLARNAYLAQLDGLGVADQVEALGRDSVGASEDLQRLSWNLVNWVRKRLYLLGIVDLGYDSHGHPVAMRLTRIGARVLGIDAGVSELTGLGRLIVTPDFEVVLFGDGDDADLVHDLDRFTDRVKEGATRQFRIDDHSVHRGLVEGLTVSRMSEILTGNARTPVPRNVLQSIRGWAQQAGLLLLDADLVVRGQDPELMARFARDAGVRPFVRATLDSTRVKLKAKTSRQRYRTLLRDLGYLIELQGE